MSDEITVRPSSASTASPSQAAAVASTPNHGIHSVPHVIFEVREGLEVRVEWKGEFAREFAIRLTDMDSGSWLCLNAELVEECGRSVARGAERLEQRFDQIAESLRLGRLRD